MSASLERRVLLRVVNVSTELKTSRDSATDPPARPQQTVQIVLWPNGPLGYDVMGGQKLVLIIGEPDHPLLDGLAVDQLFELKPVDPDAR